jgi:hypothetical protein
MKFGKSKQSTSNNVLSIPVGLNGVGSELHPKHEEMIKPKFTEDKILSIIRGEKPEVKKEVKVKKSKLKLYLNTLINILFNKDKPKRQKKIDKIRSMLFKWWIRETTNDIKDLVKFVLIHGILGMTVILTILVIIGLQTPLIEFLRRSIYLLILVFILGSGSLYYLFLDLNKVLEETWRKKK